MSTHRHAHFGNSTPQQEEIILKVHELAFDLSQQKISWDYILYLHMLKKRVVLCFGFMFGFMFGLVIPIPPTPSHPEENDHASL